MDNGNLHDGLAVHAKNKPDQIAIYYYDETRTYKELFQRANQVANGLVNKGIKKGNHVLIYMKNRIEMIEILYGISIAGAVAVPVNYMIRGDDLATLMNGADADTAFIEKETYQEINNIQDHLNVNNFIITGDESIPAAIRYEEMVRNSSTQSPEITVRSSDMAVMLYSSGTTSLPKGILITQGNMVHRIYTFSIEWNLNFNDRLLVTVPIYHAVGHQYVFFGSLLGVQLVITREFDPEFSLQLIEKHKVTHSFFVPTQYFMLLEVSSFDQYELSSLQSLVSAAAPLPESTKEKIIEKFNTTFTEFYGTTEVSPLTSLRPSEVLKEPKSVGQQTQYLVVKLVDEDGNEVPQGEEGEFAARGPSLFSGYYKRPEETEKSMLSSGFHRTGDIGRVDENGFYYLLDRKKDMIISGGVNIYTKDIEEVIYKHNDVLEAAVIGIPSKKWGEQVKAFVVLKEGKSMPADELMSFCNPKLAKYQAIKEVEFIQTLPRNPSGKILKRKLREIEK